MKTPEELFFSTVKDAGLAGSNMQDIIDLINIQLETGVDINTQNPNGETALIIATQIGKPALVKYLLTKGAKISIRDTNRFSALLIAVFMNHSNLIKMLMDADAEHTSTESDLFSLVVSGYSKEVEALLIAGANISAKDSLGNTPLMNAAHCGKIGVIKLLLEKGADINAKSNNYWTALMFAANADCREAIEMIMAKSISNQPGGSNPALVMFAASGNINAIKSLVQAGADVDCSDSYGNTPLIVATIKNHVETIEYLLEILAVKVDMSQYGLIGLGTAVHRGHVKAIQAFLKAGVDINVTDRDGKSLLSIAASLGYLDATKLLLSATTPDQIGGSGYAMGYLAGEGDFKGVETLLNAAAGIDIHNLSGYTPLMIASSKGHVHIIKLLLDAGADKDARDADGRTPLMHAGSKGQLTAMNMLLSAGANKEAQDKFGHTTLMISSYEGHVHAVKLLLADGANKDTQDNIGLTALIVAAGNNQKETLVELLDAGVDPNIKDHQGRTAFMHAFYNEHPTAVLLLEKYSPFNTEINRLKNEIESLSTYGEILSQNSVHKGSVIIPLAVELKEKVDMFRNKIISSGSFNDKQAWHEFKTDFHTTLHSQDEVLGQHREYWRILANIAIALTGLGAIFLIGQLVVSRVTTGQFSMFFSKTESLNRVDEIERVSNCIGMSA